MNDLDDDMSQTMNILKEAEFSTENRRYSKLSSGSFPQFPAETILNASQMEFMYQAVTGLAAVVRLLNRSTQLRGEQTEFDRKKSRPLRPLDESQLWCAAMALSRCLKNTFDDLYEDACGGDKP